MKILYGVQATGNGHINRSRELVIALRKRGIEVDVIFSGRDPQTLWGVDDFQPYRAFHGLSFVVKDGKIDHLRTVLKQKIFRFICEIRKLDLREYDIVITDFEPISSWAAKFAGKKILGIGHQYAFFYDIPVSQCGFIDKLVMRTFAPAEIKIGLHWDSFGTPILPPIIKKLDEPQKIIRGKILVYLAFENLGLICSTLKKFSSYNFHIYYDLKTASEDGNLCLKPFSREGFLKDLSECEGVICNAGFELPSEAIQIGKKVLMSPIHGQFEQQSNALAIEKLGLGMRMKSIDPEKIGKWLDSKPSGGIRFPQVAPVLAEWIEQQKWDSIQELSKKLWK